jgi:hypothetical protein
MQVKFVLKILLAPVIFALWLLVGVCKICIQCAAWIIGIATFLSGALTVLLLLTGDTKNGLIMLAVTLLISPFGLLMLVVWMLGQVQRLRYAIQYRVYG